MAFIESTPQEWHDGEKYMHSLLHVPEGQNPTSRGISPYGSHLIISSPLLALGVLDGDGRPWTTIIGGEPAFMRQLGRSTVAVKTLVAPRYDPVLRILLGRERGEESRKEANTGQIISGLPIDLANRNRVKLSGRLVPRGIGFEVHGDDDGIGKVQLIIEVGSTLGMQVLPSTHTDGGLTTRKAIVQNT